MRQSVRWEVAESLGAVQRVVNTLRAPPALLDCVIGRRRGRVDELDFISFEYSFTYALQLSSTARYPPALPTDNSARTRSRRDDAAGHR